MLTLTSDFGSPYPAAMKGVVLSQTDARLVDVAHDLPRGDIRTAAFWLRETLPYFPPAVHLAVVDPGVGTDRRAVAIRVGDHALVGPDNGLLRPVARRLAERASPTPTVSAFEIRVDDPASTTFHGRDVFAPAAAAVHEAGTDDIPGIEPVGAVDRFEPLPIEDCVPLRFPEPTVEGDCARGEVLVVDDFGNAITNVPGEWLRRRGDADGAVSDAEDGPGTVLVDGERVPVVETFAHVDPGERLVTVGSHGLLECDVNRGRGDDAFGLDVGTPVRFERR